MSIPGKPPYRIAGIPPGIISSDDYDVTDEALAALAALAAPAETLTVWWWPKGLGVSYDIPVPYEQKLDAPSALAFAEQLSRVEGMQFVKVFGSSERDIRWRYPADSQECSHGITLANKQTGVERCAECGALVPADTQEDKT